MGMSILGVLGIGLCWTGGHGWGKRLVRLERLFEIIN